MGIEIVTFVINGSMRLTVPPINALSEALFRCLDLHVGLIKTVHIAFSQN